MMSLKTLGAEVSSSMGGPALGGTIGNTLAELPTAATATASFETMVSGAMKSADGEGKLTTPISGVVPTIVVVEVPLRIQGPSGRATATVTEFSSSASLQNLGESELGWLPVESLVDRAESPSVRPWMLSPTAKKSPDPVPSNDSTGSEAPSFEGGERRDQAANQNLPPAELPESAMDRLPDWWIPILVQPIQLPAQELPAVPNPQVSASVVDGSPIGSTHSLSSADGKRLPLVGSAPIFWTKPETFGPDVPSAQSAKRPESEAGLPATMGSELKALHSAARPILERTWTPEVGPEAQAARPMFASPVGDSGEKLPAREVLEGFKVVDAEAFQPDGSIPVSEVQRPLLAQTRWAGEIRRVVPGREVRQAFSKSLRAGLEAVLPASVPSLETEALSAQSPKWAESEAGLPAMMGSELKAHQRTARPISGRSWAEEVGPEALATLPKFASPVGDSGEKLPAREVLEGLKVVDAEAPPPDGSIPVSEVQRPFLAQTRWAAEIRRVVPGREVRQAFSDSLMVGFEEVPPVSAPSLETEVVTFGAGLPEDEISRGEGKTQTSESLLALNSPFAEQDLNPSPMGHDRISDHSFVVREDARLPQESNGSPEADAVRKEWDTFTSSTSQSVEKQDSGAAILVDRSMIHGAENPRQRPGLPLSETADLAYASVEERATKAAPSGVAPPASGPVKSQKNPENPLFNGSFSKGGKGVDSDVTPPLKRSGMTSASPGSAMTSDRFQPSAPEGALQKRDWGLSEKGSQHSALPSNASDSRTVDSQAVISSLALGKTESAQLAEVPETPQLPQARSLSRLADQLSGEVVLMQRLRSGVMTAVLKPDAHSELRVDLRRREGRLEIRATMERGDSQAISEGWSELQQQLRAQGVHLLPLERPSSPPPPSRDSADSAGERSANSGSRGKNQQTPQETHDGTSWGRGETGQPMRPASTRSANPSAKKPDHRHLLESWA